MEHTNDDDAKLAKALEPKSDQLNADDLITGPITVRIRKVEVKGDGDQRILVFYDGDNNKPWKPGKSMGRVLRQAWGAPQNWIGKWLTLYRDPKVKWAGKEEGGIRISHMSDIKEKQTYMLTVTKGNRQPFNVLPLDRPTGVPTEEKFDIDALKTAATAEANKGTEAFKAHWSTLGGAKQKALGDVFKEELKAVAQKYDAANKPAASAVTAVQIIDPAKINLMSANGANEAAVTLATALRDIPEAERKTVFEANLGLQIAHAVTDAGGTLPPEFLGLL